MSDRLLLSELVRGEVKQVAPQATLVFPAASTEQHGPHLPLATDSIIAGEIAVRAATIASRQVPVVVAPVIPFGNSHHHLIYCALSLRSSTYVSLLEGLVDCAVQAGFRRLFFLNSHGGNDEAIRMIARDLVLRCEVRVGAGSYWAIAQDALRALGLNPNWGLPGHAGGFETSLMMALRPDLVREEQAPGDAAHPTSISNQGIAPGMLVVRSGEWKRINGYSDAPVGASAGTGQRVLQVITAEVARAIVAFHQATGS